MKTLTVEFFEKREIPFHQIIKSRLTKKRNAFNLHIFSSGTFENTLLTQFEEEGLQGLTITSDKEQWGFWGVDIFPLMKYFMDYCHIKPIEIMAMTLSEFSEETVPTSSENINFELSKYTSFQQSVGLYETSYTLYNFEDFKKAYDYLDTLLEGEGHDGNIE